MFITRLRLTNEVSSETIFDRYKTHQFIWELFRSESRDHLYRVQANPDHWEIIIFSQTRPETPAWATSDNFITKKLPDSFFKHKKYRFMLTANATKHDPENGNRRVPIFENEKLLNWITRKGEQHGFKVVECGIKSMGKVTFKKNNVPGTLHAVDFCGTLEVSDKEKFFAAMHQGIGPARAFGLGMMQVILCK